MYYNTGVYDAVCALGLQKRAENKSTKGVTDTPANTPKLPPPGSTSGGTPPLAQKDMNFSSVPTFPMRSMSPGPQDPFSGPVNNPFKNPVFNKTSHLKKKSFDAGDIIKNISEAPSKVGIKSNPDFNEALNVAKDALIESGLYAAPGIALPFATKYMLQKGVEAEQKYGKPLTKDQINALKGKIKTREPLAIVSRLKDPTKATFIPEANIILAAKETPAGVLSHEMGHATKDLSKYIKRKAIFDKLAPLVGLPGLLGTSFLDPESTAAKIAPWTSVLPHLPVLYEEGRASLKGYRGLRSIGKGRSALLSQIPAYLTYLGAAATPGIGAELVRRYKLKKKKEKEAEPTERLKRLLGIS